MNRDGDFAGRLPEMVVRFRHRPVSWFQFLTEVELEDANHFGFEQLQIQVMPDAAFNIRLGLILLPLGIINLWHEPTTYLTVDRPLTDRLIIPTTWRELGVGIFGALGTEGRYEVQVVAGLDAAGFSATAPLWGGRGNGGGVAAHDAAVVGRLELGHSPKGFALGGGGYWGGASGGHPQLTDVTVTLVEADARFRGAGFDLRAEAAEFFIRNSYKVNDYLGLLAQDAVPSSGRGFYAQAGYDVLAATETSTRQELIFFVGFENVNPRSRMSPYNYNPPTITGPGGTPPNAPSASQSFVRGGVCYRPIAALAFKLDVQVALDAEGAAPAAPVSTAGAPGTPKALPGFVAEAGRGRTLVGAAAAFEF
jgi:hypothetical protein